MVLRETQLLLVSPRGSSVADGAGVTGAKGLQALLQLAEAQPLERVRVPGPRPVTQCDSWKVGRKRLQKLNIVLARPCVPVYRNGYATGSVFNSVFNHVSPAFDHMSEQGGLRGLAGRRLRGGISRLAHLLPQERDHVLLLEVPVVAGPEDLQKQVYALWNVSDTITAPLGLEEHLSDF